MTSQFHVTLTLSRQHMRMLKTPPAGPMNALLLKHRIAQIHVINGEVLELAKIQPRFTKNAVHSILPSAPAYLSMRLPAKRKSRYFMGHCPLNYARAVDTSQHVAIHFVWMRLCSRRTAASSIGKRERELIRRNFESVRLAKYLLDTARGPRIGNDCCLLYLFKRWLACSTQQGRCVRSVRLFNSRHYFRPGNLCTTHVAHRAVPTPFSEE